MSETQGQTPEPKPEKKTADKKKYQAEYYLRRKAEGRLQKAKRCPLCTVWYNNRKRHQATKIHKRVEAEPEETRSALISQLGAEIALAGTKTRVPLESQPPSSAPEEEEGCEASSQPAQGEE